MRLSMRFSPKNNARLKDICYWIMSLEISMWVTMRKWMSSIGFKGPTLMRIINSILTSRSTILDLGKVKTFHLASSGKNSKSNSSFHLIIFSFFFPFYFAKTNGSRVKLGTSREVAFWRIGFRKQRQERFW